MDTLYLVVLGFLLILAIFDLSVGVANDAVNFLSPAVGARAAKFKTILGIAAVGIFIGAATSSGMMEMVFCNPPITLLQMLCVCFWQYVPPM